MAEQEVIHPHNETIKCLDEKTARLASGYDMLYKQMTEMGTRTNSDRKNDLTRWLTEIKFKIKEIEGCKRLLIEFGEIETTTYI